MATDGPTPAPCAKNIWEQGTTVLVTHSIPSNALERWVRAVAALSGQLVDWGFVGGRARIVALGDLAAVYQALDDLRAVHDRLYNVQKAKSLVPDDPNDRPPWYQPDRETTDGR